MSFSVMMARSARDFCAAVRDFSMKISAEPLGIPSPRACSSRVLVSLLIVLLSIDKNSYDDGGKSKKEETDANE